MFNFRLCRNLTYCVGMCVTHLPTSSAGGGKPPAEIVVQRVSTEPYFWIL